MKSVISKKDETDNTPSSTSKDQVEISETTNLMHEAEDIATNAPDVNEAAVAKAKEAIENGEMEIDFDRLAQKMLDFEFNLFDS